YRRGLHSVGFESPTGNIRCAISSDDDTQLLCTTLNNKNTVDLDMTPEMNTNWTVTIPAGNPTLAYGNTWYSPYFHCWSEFDGTFCRSLYSRYGFHIDRDAIEAYIWPKAILTLSAGNGYDGGSGVFDS